MGNAKIRLENTTKSDADATVFVDRVKSWKSRTTMSIKVKDNREYRMAGCVKMFRSKLLLLVS